MVYISNVPATKNNITEPMSVIFGSFPSWMSIKLALCVLLNSTINRAAITINNNDVARDIFNKPTVPRLPEKKYLIRKSALTGHVAHRRVLLKL